MPADVNGTINIIAEVVGNNQSPSKAGSILEGRNKKQTDANRKGFLEMVKHSKTLRFIMFGLVTQSSVMSTTLGALVRFQIGSSLSQTLNGVKTGGLTGRVSLIGGIINGRQKVGL